MASLPPRPADDGGFQTFVMIVSGIATGAVVTGLIEAVRTLSPFIAELIR
jgi:hypothetical protein